jgi:hypothetical protein
VRALESPDQTTRRPAAFHDTSEVRVRLDFTAAYTGWLELYAIDWDGSARRQRVTVDDGSGVWSIDITTSFNGGAWMYVPVSVAGGGSITVRAIRTAGANAVLSGILLGDGPSPASPDYGAGIQGDWVGAYGANGHLLAAWNASSDLIALPGVSSVLEQGSRFRWASSTGDVRALESPAQSERRAAAYYHATEVRVRLSFASAYSGNLHLYALDWDNNDRRQSVTVADGTSTTVVDIVTNFREGAWVHVPISVPAGGVVTIRVVRTGGANAVLSGVFLGD